MTVVEHDNIDDEETNVEAEFKIDRLFAALRPIFENNMLAQREFELPENILECKSDHYDRDFITITSNVYTKSAEIELRSPDRGSCFCKTSDNCGDSCYNRSMQVECVADLCQCGENCQNQKIQKQMNAPVNVFRTKYKGFGIKAASRIDRGSFIMEYIGEVITKDNYEKRLMMHYSNDMNFYCISLEKSYVIDSRNMGNICRFINHSCQPNCEMQTWKINGLPRLALFATEDIDNDEELTYDYDFTSYGSASAQSCFCDSNVCKIFIGNRSQGAATQNIENEQPVIEPSIASSIEPNVGIKLLPGYRIPKLNSGQTFEPMNCSEYSRDCSGSFRVKNPNEVSRRYTDHSHKQGYGRDSAGTYRINNFKTKSNKSSSKNRNKMLGTADSNRVSDFPKSSNEFSRAQNRRPQMLAAAGSHRNERFQMNQNVSNVHEIREDTDGRSSVFHYNLRHVGNLSYMYIHFVIIT